MDDHMSARAGFHWLEVPQRSRDLIEVEGAPSVTFVTSSPGTAGGCALRRAPFQPPPTRAGDMAGRGPVTLGVPLAQSAVEVDAELPRSLVLREFVDQHLLGLPKRGDGARNPLLLRACAVVADGQVLTEGVEQIVLAGLVEGGSDVAFFWRSYPWDHVPGALILGEAGGAALRLDGTAYDPADGRTGLLVARDARTWVDLRAMLLTGSDEI